MIPSVVALVGALQAHGLTAEALDDMVRFCEQRRTGSVTYHIVDGTLRIIEIHGKRRLDTEPSACPLTMMP